MAEAEKKVTEKKEAQAAPKKKTGLIVGIIAGIAAVGLAIFLIIQIATGGRMPVGDYKLTGMEENGTDASSSIALMEAFGITYKIKIEDGSKGKMTIAGEEKEFTYDGKKIKTDEGEMDYTFKDDKLTLKQDDTTMTFTLQK